MERLEHEASRERAKSQELDREVKRLKGRVETHNRVYLVTKGELDLVKDKFKALEKRLNRTLLENDLVRRAIQDLAKKSGIAAGRTELTADEIAASDRTVEESAQASKPSPTPDVAAVAEPQTPEPEQARPA
jgi:chromosome segregation ATPase